MTAFDHEDSNAAGRTNGPSIIVFMASLAVVILASIALFERIMGLRPINPTDLSWMHNDIFTHDLAWRFLRQETNWTLPLTWTKLVGYPLGVPLAIFDGVPLIAIILRPFSSMLPETFQYLGPYLFLCYLMQGAFGFLIARRFIVDSLVGALFMAAFFLISPPFIWRSFGHISLSSHWAILAAILFYFSERRHRRQYTIYFCILLFVIGSVSPYIALMVYIVGISFIFKSYDLQNNLGKFILCGIFLSGSLFLSLYLIGLIQFGSSSALSAGGFGIYSMNLLSPIDPNRFSSILLKQQSSMPLQEEGYNYLGLGILLALLILAVKNKTLNNSQGFSKFNVRPLVFISIVLFIWSLSTKIMLGSHILIDVSLNEQFEQVLSVFRVSGRLFWVPYYVITLFALVGIYSMYGRFTGVVLLGFLLLIQYFDTRSLRASIHEVAYAAQPSLPLKDVAWQGLGKTYKHLMVLPAWQCSAQTPGGANGFWTFGSLAVDQHMTINSYYAGRYSDAQMKLVCIDQPSEVVKMGFSDRDTAYVVDSSLLTQIPHQPTDCRALDGLNLCAKSPR